MPLLWFLDHTLRATSDLETARRLLGPDAIIGVTVSSPEEAFRACEGGADYLGIGTVYSTQTQVTCQEM